MRKLKNLAEKIIFYLENKLGVFISFTFRPIKSEKITIISDQIKNKPKCAIVIQGPIIYEKNFTLETIKIYKKLYPDTDIILSTWNTEDESYIQKIEKENIIIVLSPLPEYFGIANINLQIDSSYNGIRKARDRGNHYILKTRTDQRMYGENNIEFLCNLLKIFPPAKNCKQKGRIISISLDTFKYRWYGISDMFIFGYTEDVLNYWSVEKETKKFLEDRKKEDEVSQKIQYPLCEVKLATNFLKKIGKEVKWTFRDSLQALKDNFIIVSQVDMDLYWHKYQRYMEHRTRNYKLFNRKTEINFKEWLNIYSDLENKTLNIDNEEIKKLKNNIF